MTIMQPSRTLISCAATYALLDCRTVLIEDSDNKCYMLSWTYPDSVHYYRGEMWRVVLCNTSHHIGAMQRVLCSRPYVRVGSTSGKLSWRHKMEDWQVLERCRSVCGRLESKHRGRRKRACPRLDGRQNTCLWARWVLWKRLFRSSKDVFGSHGLVSHPRPSLGLWKRCLSYIDCHQPVGQDDLLGRYRNCRSRRICRLQPQRWVRLIRSRNHNLWHVAT